MEDGIICHLKVKCELRHQYRYRVEYRCQQCSKYPQYRAGITFTAPSCNDLTHPNRYNVFNTKLPIYRLQFRRFWTRYSVLHPIFRLGIWVIRARDNVIFVKILHLDSDYEFTGLMQLVEISIS